MRQADPQQSTDDLLRANAELQRINRALRVGAACHHALLRAPDEASLLRDVCQAIVELGGYRLAWVGYAESDEHKSVRPVASFGFEEGYLESVGFSWGDVPRGRGPVGESIRAASTAVVRSIQTDPRFEPWRAQALRRGYGASISLPLTLAGKVFGALVIYSSEAGTFGSDEVDVLNQAAEDLSHGIGEFRAREEYGRLRAALTKSEGWLRAALQGSLDALLLLRPVYEGTGAVTDFEFLDVNPRAEKLLGQSRDALVGGPLSSALPEVYEDLVRRYLPVLETGRALEEVFSVRMPQERTLWVRHQIVPIEDGIAVIVRDITERVEASQRLQDTEKNYKELLESLQEGIWAADPEGRTTFVNLPMANMLGYEPEEMLGRSVFEFVDERLHDSFRYHFGRRAEGIKGRYEFEFRRKDGAAAFLDIEGAPRYDSAGTFIGRIAGIMNVTRRRQAEEELHASLRNLAKAEELANLGTWTYERAARSYTASAEMRRILGLPPGTEPIPVDEVLRLFHPEERAGVQEDLTAMLQGRPIREERRIIRPDGEGRILLFQSEPMYDETGRVVRVSGFAQDVTERNRYEAQLEYLATHDALTALPNRRVLEDRIGQVIAHLARTPGKSLAVLYLDLDRFKLVNDSLGHSVGDELLRTVARILQSNVRGGDTVARQGGDEFIILLQDIRWPSDVMAVIEKIQGIFARPLSVNGRELYASFSIGVSLYPADGENIESLLKNADAAMYRAKQSGGGVQFYTQELSRQATERVELENDIRHALESDEFELYYQPQVSVADGRIVGAEALIRWNHRREGLVLPGRFIPIAEDTGLIGPIGDWVIKRACEDSLRWSNVGFAPIRVAVNVSTSQFHNGRIEDVIAAMAKRGVLRANGLELEITERVVMDDTEDAIARLARLKALGVSISVDDFGTGYSSLNYLRRLPIDRIKIDQSFVRDLGSHEDARTLVGAIIDLSRAFGFKVLAEGVETEEQAAILVRNGCNECQGFFFAKPMPVRDFEEALRRGFVAASEARRSDAGANRRRQSDGGERAA